MRSRGPIITLLVVVVLAAVLLVVNLSKGSGDTAAQAAGPAASTPPPAPAAAAEPIPAQAKYTGHTDGINAAIAVTVRGGKVSAYLCDGKSVEGWYQGTATGDSLQARGRATNALTGSLSGGTLSGTVSAGGRSWSYTAAPSAAPAGLYRSKTSNTTVGWIKDSNGQVTGLANEGGTARPAPPLDTGTATAVEGGDVVVGQ